MKKFIKEYLFQKIKCIGRTEYKSKIKQTNYFNFKSFRRCKSIYSMKMQFLLNPFENFSRNPHVICINNTFFGIKILKFY